MYYNMQLLGQHQVVVFVTTPDVCENSTAPHSTVTGGHMTAAKRIVRFSDPKNEQPTTGDRANAFQKTQKKQLPISWISSPHNVCGHLPW
jgi:hypothetical protein